jgi:hypothetical protein
MSRDIPKRYGRAIPDVPGPPDTIRTSDLGYPGTSRDAVVERIGISRDLSGAMGAIKEVGIQATGDTKLGS